MLYRVAVSLRATVCRLAREQYQPSAQLPQQWSSARVIKCDCTAVAPKTPRTVARKHGLQWDLSEAWQPQPLHRRGGGGARTTTRRYNQVMDMNLCLRAPPTFSPFGTSSQLPGRLGAQKRFVSNEPRMVMEARIPRRTSSSEIANSAFFCGFKIAFTTSGSVSISYSSRSILTVVPTEFTP